ncbi:MAG: murein biosynthesis integral membrane protein MurJ [Anaerolinea sp.]|nr:murein biosynthesis integral membrane protein MurJ [Anaerolinea sp.]
MQRARHLLQSSVLVILFLGAGKLTGLVRVRLVSVTFGAGTAFDAFTAANQLPEVFFTLIAGGSLAAAFIPVYAAYLARESASNSVRLANTILTLVILLLGAVSAAGALCAPWLARVVLVPSVPAAQQQLTAEIMRIILVQTTLFGISGVLSSVLNAHQHFALPALAPIALDIGYFVGITWLQPWGIHGLAWGTVVGGVLHIAIQVPALLRYRYRYRPSFAWQLDGVREIIRLMGPRVVTLGVVQVADLFIIRLASGLPTGSTSAYFYGYALMQFPETLFGTAIALVLFPTLAELYNAGDVAGLRRAAGQTLSIIWTLTIPAAVGMVMLGRPIVAFLLEGGAFDAAASALVYAILLAFSVRIVSEATLEIVARLFYAQHNTRTPMFAYLGWLAINVGLAYALVGRMGIVGLALASTVAFTVLAAVLFVLNRRVLGGLDERPLAGSAGRALAAAAGMGLVIWGVGQVISSQLLLLLVGGVAGGLSYLALHWLLGGQEIPRLIQLARRRV